MKIQSLGCLLVAALVVGDRGQAADGVESAITEFSQLVSECRGKDQVPRDARERIDVLIAELAAQGTAANAAVPHLITAWDLYYFHDRDLRGVAAEALSKVCAKPAEVFPPLIVRGHEGPDELRFTDDYDLVDQAGRGLSDQAVIALLSHDDWRVRCWAIRHISDRMVEKGSAAFTTARERTERTAWKIRDYRERGAAVSKAVDDAMAKAAGHLTAPLIPMLADLDPDVRAFAVAALSRSRPLPPTFLPTVLELFNDHGARRYHRDFVCGHAAFSGKNVREAAISAAGQMNHPLALATWLERALHDPDANVRQACLQALASRRYGGLWPDVVESAVKDEHDGVFEAGVSLIGPAYASPTMVDALVAALGKDSRMPRAVAALSEFGPASRAAVPSLIALLEQGRYESGVMRCLGAIGTGASAALPTLKQRLESSEPAMRVDAARAIWRIKPDAALVLPVYVATLREPATRASACHGLGEMECAAASAVPLLVELLSAQKNGCDANVVRALGAIGPGAEAALPALDALAADRKQYISTTAKEAASRIRGEPKQ